MRRNPFRNSGSKLVEIFWKKVNPFYQRQDSSPSSTLSSHRLLHDSFLLRLCVKYYTTWSNVTTRVCVEVSEVPLLALTRDTASGRDGDAPTPPLLTRDLRLWAQGPACGPFFDLCIRVRNKVLGELRVSTTVHPTKRWSAQNEDGEYIQSILYCHYNDHYCQWGLQIYPDLPNVRENVGKIR